MSPHCWKLLQMTKKLLVKIFQINRSSGWLHTVTSSDVYFDNAPKQNSHVHSNIHTFVVHFFFKWASRFDAWLFLFRNICLLIKFYSKSKSSLTGLIWRPDGPGRGLLWESDALHWVDLDFLYLLSAPSSFSTLLRLQTCFPVVTSFWLC